MHRLRINPAAKDKNKKPRRDSKTTFVGATIGRPPLCADNSKTKPLYVILSGVELLPSGKRGRSAKRNAVCGIWQRVLVAFESM